MEWMQTKKRVRETKSNQVSGEYGSNTTKLYRTPVIEQAQNRNLVYHGQGNFLPHNTRGDLTNGGVREPRSFLQEERAVIQCQIHPSFLSESYEEASQSTDVNEWIDEFQMSFQRENGRQPRDSEILRMALRRARVPDSIDPDSGQKYGIDWEIRNQAHHIVEAHDENALEARCILKNAGIEINSAANGVFLPEWETDNTGGAATHLGSHIREYAFCVELALRTAVGGTDPGTEPYRDRVLKRLAQIRQVLLTCNAALNARGDADWSLNTEGPDTVIGIFEDNGLFNDLFS